MGTPKAEQTVRGFHWGIFRYHEFEKRSQNTQSDGENKHRIYLFVISVVMLPIISLYRKSTKKLNTDKLNLIIITMLFLIPFVCRDFLSIGGKGFLYYLIFFAIGYFILSNEKILDRYAKYRTVLYPLCILSVALVLAIRFINLDTTVFINGFLYGLTNDFCAYITTITLLVFAKKHLNFTNNITKYFTNSSFSVYMFHHLWIVAAAYYIFKVTENSFVRILLIMAISIPLTFLSHQIFKQFKVTRFMFGIKSESQNLQHLADNKNPTVP